MGLNVVITGASKGIGKALALKFAENPDNKLLLIARDAARLEILKEKCGPERTIIMPCDLSEDDTPRKIAQRIEKEWDKVDILINNAGMLVNKPFTEIRVEEFDKCIVVNYRSALFLAQALYKLIRKGDVRHIVNIGSMGGVQGSQKFPGLSVYSSTKGALAILSECLAVEMEPDGISVNCLALGSVQTEMLESAFPGYKAESSPESMARFIHNFATEMGPNVNGKVIPVSMVGV